MQISPVGLTLIKTSEGFVSHVYNDNGSLAIGYGHRLRPSESFPQNITEAQASDLLLLDLDTRYEPFVRARVPKNCTQNQYDALCSFVYNIRNQPSSLDQLLSHGWDQVAVQLLRWCHKLNVHTHLEEEDGSLLARRKREAALFLA